jgi:hypothetical protein
MAGHDVERLLPKPPASVARMSEAKSGAPYVPHLASLHAAYKLLGMPH